MPCENCGSPCQGTLCAGCEQIQRCEAIPEIADDEDSDTDHWVEQTGLDGDRHTGQTTLSGGVARDAGGEE